MIRLRDVTYFYPRATTPALANVTLEIPAGQFCAVIGANGAGKSTLCYTLAGFVPHFYRGKLSGGVEVAGVDVPASSLAKLVTSIGLLVAILARLPYTVDDARDARDRRRDASVVRSGGRMNTRSESTGHAPASAVAPWKSTSKIMSRPAASDASIGALAVP